MPKFRIAHYRSHRHDMVVSGCLSVLIVAGGLVRVSIMALRSSKDLPNHYGAVETRDRFGLNKCQSGGQKP